MNATLPLCLALLAPVTICPTQDGRVPDPNKPGTTFRAELEGVPSQIGQWDAPVFWPVIAIHAAMLPSGEVLHYSYPAGGSGSNAFTWDPITDTFTDVEGMTDIFCSGLSFLPDGQLYVTGGNDYACEFQGRQVTYLFDSFTRTWSFEGNMSVGRWYPSNVTLGDGRVVILTGLGLDCKPTPVMEMYTPGQGLQVLPNQAFVPLYPSLHLLSSGLVAMVAPAPDAYLYDPDSQQWSYVDTSSGGARWAGTSVLLPGTTDEVMIIGGGAEFDGTSTATCERINFNDAIPSWRSTGSMNVARAHANVVILPDDRVLVIGGGDGPGLYESPVLNAEIYDPVAETWSMIPPQTFSRMYHSTAVLLPDGRVVSAGQDNGLSGFRQEVYSPSYLFQGSRPAIGSVPDVLNYSGSFIINTPDAKDIDRVTLIGLTSVTHSVNMHQRSVALSFGLTSSTTLVASAPDDMDLAPAGYYMLFIVDDQGIPSIAEMVRLEDFDCPADWNGNMFLNTADFVAYLNDYSSVLAGNPWTYGDPDIAAPFGALNTADFIAFLNLYNAGCS